jgi:hypothetical protein
MLFAQTVKRFVQDAYQLISASSPTVPLHGSDMEKGVHFLNNLLKSYSSSSLLLTIAKKIKFTINPGQLFATFADPTFVPAPTVAQGRLTNLQNAWLELDGVDYPLIDESRGVFFGSYKFFPQLGLPRFVIITNDLDVTTMQFYPGPSQAFDVFVYGKFQLQYITENDTMASLPQYYLRFLTFALARDLAYYKGRSSAWDSKLEAMYKEARDDMESVTAVNLVVDSANESYLNGSWRLRAGI